MYQEPSLFTSQHSLFSRRLSRHANSWLISSASKSWWNSNSQFSQIGKAQKLRQEVITTVKWLFFIFIFT